MWQFFVYADGKLLKTGVTDNREWTKSQWSEMTSIKFVRLN